jgi:hypothetical protein
LSDDVSMEGISALRKLSSLQEFLFCDADFTGDRDPLMDQIDYCYRRLPHLHAVAIKPSLDFNHKELSRMMGRALHYVCRNPPRTLQLRHLVLLDLHNIPSAEKVSLPEVQVLHLAESMGGGLRSGCLPKLSELNWREPDTDDMMSALRRVGHQLKTLRVSNISRTLQLGSVLEACPNLCNLTINASVELSDQLPHTLSQLQTLDISIHSYNNPSMLLQLLRRAPELRSIKFSLEKLSRDTMRELTELAKEGTCMQHLQQIILQFKSWFLRHDPSRQLLDEAIVSCTIHCPKLKHVSISEL